ncbi:MAG: hypothetical protein CVU71_10890 [Deltaproteobacteria bacterium HGW-Deltaproteobacteria-6]|nr:MAG: hypothetical protein CVU71_10890 [Deltaproteobacteria bacterium HGW-Deltaproteobacteria-6]
MNKTKTMKETTPLLSILIPTWNRVDQVIRAIESIGPSPGDLEVIVVDNASDEAISNRLKELLAGKDYVRFFRNEANIGMVRNWNKCIAYAKGKWMGLLCSDDEYYPGAVHHIRDILRSRQTPAVVLQDASIAAPYVICKAGAETIRGIRLPLASGNFWHRDVSETIGPFDERLEYSPDAEYWFRAASRFPVIKVKKPMAKYHAHESNYMWETWAKDDFLDQTALLIRLNCRYLSGDQYNDETVNRVIDDGLKQTLFTILETTALMIDKKDLFDRYCEVANTMMKTEDESQRLSRMISRHHAFLNNLGRTTGESMEKSNNMNIPITFMITVYNEESRIRYVLEHAVRWADEIIVFIKASTDRTRAICEEFGERVKIIDRPFSPRGHGDTVGDAQQASNNWIFFGTASEIPTYNLIQNVRNMLSETKGELDLIYVPRKYYSFGIHDKRSPWYISYFPFLINRDRAIIANVIHSNFRPRNPQNTRVIQFSDDCCVYHFTHPSAKDYMLDMTQYFEAEAESCTDPAQKIQMCINNIAQFEKQLVDAGPPLLGHYLAWHIYWLGTALFVWEKQRGLNVGEYYRALQEEIIQKEWLSPREQKEALFPGEQYDNIRKMLEQNNHVMAIEALEKVLVDHPNLGIAHHDLATLYSQTVNSEKALEHYELAVKLEPNNITFLKSMANFLYTRQKETQKALQLYIKILSINPADIEVLLVLGHIATDNGQLDRAKDFYRRVLDIDPANTDACRWFAMLGGQNHDMKPKQVDPAETDVTNSTEDYLVSAIVSAYNSERFIRGCIEDLEAQTIADKLEIVVVDSCSPQKERAVVEEFQRKYSNIKYIRTEERETVYAAWNRGIKAASGKYITNANTDDRHRKDAFEIMVNELERKPEITLVYADVIITEKENETFDQHTPCGHYRWYDWDRSVLLNQGCFMGPQPMWRRSVHHEYGYFDDSMVSSGDYEFWLRISQTHNFFHIKTPLGLYLKSPESIEHSNREKQRDENNRILALYRQKAQQKQAAESDAVKEISPLMNPEFITGMTSIIILTQNRLDQTKKCVKSIRKYTSEAHEIIFIDNGSTDSTVKWLQGQIRENKNCRLIENKKNVGLPKGRNQGINLSTGEWIVLIDNDTVVSEGWLSGMLECLNHAPAAGIVGPMTNSTNGLQQVTDEAYQTADRLDKLAAAFKERFHNRRIPYRDIKGFCMLFKRTLVEKIGLFDERFDSGRFEDEDLCWRSALEDYQNYICGDVFIYHSGGKRSSGDRQVIDKKWSLSMATPEGRKMAILKASEFADILYSQGKIDQAVEALVNCIKFSPDAKEIYYELTRMFIESKRFSEAWEVVGTMPETAKSELKGLECAGYAKEGLGLDDEAAGYLDKMLSLNENYPPALNLKGVLAYKKGDKPEALSCFQKAINADPGYGEAYTNLGVLDWGMDDKKNEALTHLKKGFILSPTLPDASSLYYSVVSSLGLFDDAEADFREVANRYPSNKNIAFLFIDILIQQAKFTEALILIQDVLVSYGLDDSILNAAVAVRENVGPLQIEKTSKKGTLSLCMIVKNEEKHLVRCLKSVRDVVDEIIMVDTGSTDRTIDIGKIFGAKIFEFPWTGDFSAARNESLKYATGDWILILDADEVLSPLDFKELKDIIHKKSSSPAAYSIITRNYLNNMSVIGWMPNTGQYPEEAGAGWVPSPKVRLYPRRKEVFFINPVHELLESSLKKAKIPIHPSNIIVHHYGKLDMERDAQKGIDYYLLGKIKYESDPTNMKYIYELAKQAHLLNKYEESVELWLKLLSLYEKNASLPSHQEFLNFTFGDPLPEIYTQLTAALLSLNRFNEALEAATKAMAQKTKLKECINLYAMCEMVAGSLDRAFHALENQLKAMPDYAPALVLKGAIHCLQGENDKSHEIFSSMKEKRISISTLLNKLSRNFHTIGKNDKALLILNAEIENKISNMETMELLEQINKEMAN